MCAPEQTDPFVTVHGTAGTAVFHYTEDILEITTADGTTSETFARTDLLENLLAHRADGTALLSSLENSGAFMSVLEAVRTAEDPHRIAPEHIEWVGEGAAAHPVVADIASWIERATAAQATFSELGAPWARPATATDAMEVSGTEVAREISGARLARTLSPRPYLHPVTTLAGTIVTDAMPLDHVWHLGAGVALQDVNGVNFGAVGRTGASMANMCGARTMAGSSGPHPSPTARPGQKSCSGSARTQPKSCTKPGAGAGCPQMTAPGQ